MLDVGERGGTGREARRRGHGGNGMAPVPVRHSEREEGKEDDRGGPLVRSLNISPPFSLLIETSSFSDLIGASINFYKMFKNSCRLPMLFRSST